jgi:RecG-like helicase
MKKPKSPLQVIPGIGPSLAEDLESLGIQAVSDLKGKDPQKLYDKLCQITHSRQDPCVLYTFRCAVYFAETKKPDKKLLKWWNWKDKETTSN